QNDRWTDFSEEAVARRKRDAGRPLPVLATIDRGALDPDDATSFDLFAYNTEIDLEATRFPTEFLGLNQMEGVQQDPALVLSAMAVDRVGDLDDVVGRLRALPALIDQTIELLRRGLTAGVT